MKAQLGSQVFAAQFQQNPTPPDGNMIKRIWLQRYDTALDRGKFDRVILTCDPAGKAGPKNDYTAYYLQPIPIVAPVLLTRDDPWPWPRDPWPIDWSPRW